MSNFELEGWDDINKNGGTVGTGINQAVHRLTVAIFNSGSKTSSQLAYLKNQIGRLNTNLEESNESSDKLTRALNKITLWGVIIAGVAAMIAIGNFVLDLLNYLNS
jgi:hypothetical protein